MNISWTVILISDIYLLFVRFFISFLTSFHSVFNWFYFLGDPWYKVTGNLWVSFFQITTCICTLFWNKVLYRNMYINLWSPLLMTRSSSRARQPLSRVNLTGFTMPTSGKNRKYLSIKKAWNIFKNWLCPNFSCYPKNLSCPKFWRGCKPPLPRPPPGNSTPFYTILLSTLTGKKFGKLKQQRFAKASGHNGNNIFAFR